MGNVSKITSFKWKKISKRNEKFIKNYDENSDKEYILETDLENSQSSE